jgi:DNA-binding XRE family transcriptional regulator
MKLNITTNKLQQNILNRISPKVLSANSNIHFFTDKNKDIGKLLFKLRNLYKYSTKILALKLNITEEEYKKLEKGKSFPSRQSSQLLFSIYNL